jgi:hypothetical protein
LCQPGRIFPWSKIMSRQKTLEVPRLFALWNDPDYTRSEITRELQLTEKQLQAAARRYGLQRREQCHRAFSMHDAASQEENEASADSLQLSPWVQARIHELGIGMPK